MIWYSIKKKYLLFVGCILDCALLTTHGSTKLHWLGLQNEALEHLNHSGPYAILEPNRCFAEMVRASLIPQFTDFSYDMNQSLVS